MIALSLAPNFRDVGALPVMGGRTLRPGMLYRSEAVLDPTPDDAVKIRGCGIRMVFDLRSGVEALRAPNEFWEQEGIEHCNLDLLSGFPRDHNPWAVLRDDPSRAGGAALMHALYAGMPRAALSHLPRLFDAAALGKVPLLVHCTAGKDRTGFMIAMLLAALGVEAAAIEADYMASAGRKTAVAREATRHMARSYVGGEIGDDAIEEIMGVKPSYLAASFAAIEADFGGIDAYLARVGLDPARRSAFQAKLIA
ncbi:MAG: tyrosine-protein phosphatase [Novosphingobium sp.]|nr:tyrosine-protein phosphatase [Novosphingobium sp.]